MTFDRLKLASFTHSTVYAILLTVWLIPGLHPEEFVFGLAHGLGWIAMCFTRDSDGRWLAGRRAPWLASWPGRWALGAGGAVDLGENPADTLTRELREEWSVEAERVQVDALVRLPHNLVMFVGTAWLPPGAEVRPDHEHDTYAWWPPAVSDWPEEAHEELRAIPELLFDGASA